MPGRDQGELKGKRMRRDFKKFKDFVNVYYGDESQHAYISHHSFDFIVPDIQRSSKEA